MTAFVAQLVLILAAVAAFIHAILTDPASDAIFSPKVKAGLGLVGACILLVLPAIQQTAKGLRPPPLAMFLLAALLALVALGCGGAKHAEAETVYSLQLADCVDQSGNRASADECTDRVQAAWGRLPDGGRIQDGGAE